MTNGKNEENIPDLTSFFSKTGSYVPVNGAYPSDGETTISHDTEEFFESNDNIDKKSLPINIEKESYYELKGELPFLSKKQFIEWEDMQEIFSRGYIDMETIDAVFQEVGVLSNDITCEQFIEMVDVINQVSIALESSEGGQNSWNDNDEYEGNDDNDNDDDNDDSGINEDELKRWFSNLSKREE
jgi:hypothetical protein